MGSLVLRTLREGYKPRKRIPCEQLCYVLIVPRLAKVIWHNKPNNWHPYCDPAIDVWVENEYNRIVDEQGFRVKSEGLVVLELRAKWIRARSPEGTYHNTDIRLFEDCKLRNLTSEEWLEFRETGKLEVKGNLVDVDG